MFRSKMHGTGSCSYDGVVVYMMWFGAQLGRSCFTREIVGRTVIVSKDSAIVSP